MRDSGGVEMNSRRDRNNYRLLYYPETRTIWAAILIGICAIGLLPLLGPAASAQSIFANVSGTVTDASGAVVPDARITVQDVNSKAARRITTSASGYYSIAELPAGTYNIMAEAK